MQIKRSAGALLHIGSLPGPYGIGDLGQEAHAFVDWLAAAKQSWWQILPIGPANDLPIGRHNDPYSAQSSWAGSPLYVSLDALVAAGDLTKAEVAACRVNSSRVNYPALRKNRARLFAAAAARFFA